MFPRERIAEIVKGYDPDKVAIATICSHSSLQIFHGAKQEGFRTIGIARGEVPRYYDAFPKAKPDEFLFVDDYKQVLNLSKDLVDRNAIVIPHGSFVEYMGADRFLDLGVPTYGNRAVLPWESDRSLQREWLTEAGIHMPIQVEDPKTIDRPVMVKYSGAKGGRGFFIARDYNDFKMGIDWNQDYIIQEYILGTRYYIHFFYSPIKQEGYRTGAGTLELMGFDRRDETNIDEMYKLGSQEELKKHGLFPTFVVTGNVPLAIRESLLPKVFDMGSKIIESSIERFGGMVGPFCLETIVTDKLEFIAFEISTRIVAGTNIYPTGSPYTAYAYDDMSTGRRMAVEIRQAFDQGKTELILS